MTNDERSLFFTRTLPGIQKLTLQLPELVAAPIPLLKCGRSRSISLSQQQVGSLLANAFMCTFPCRNVRQKRKGERVETEYSNYGDIQL